MRSGAPRLRSVRNAPPQAYERHKLSSRVRQPPGVEIYRSPAPPLHPDCVAAGLLQPQELSIFEVDGSKAKVSSPPALTSLAARIATSFRSVYLHREAASCPRSGPTASPRFVSSSMRLPCLHVYCQCLCLLAKLFLDHKTLYYDVSCRPPDAAPASSGGGSGC